MESKCIQIIQTVSFVRFQPARLTYWIIISLSIVCRIVRPTRPVLHQELVKLQRTRFRHLKRVGRRRGRQSSLDVRRGGDLEGVSIIFICQLVVLTFLAVLPLIDGAVVVKKSERGFSKSFESSLGLILSHLVRSCRFHSLG